jgi:hypothetical protein
MNSFTAFTCAALLFAAPCIALAQNETAANSLPDPADMRVMVPAPDYHSPLNDYLGITEAVDSPAKNWRSANVTFPRFFVFQGTAFMLPVLPAVES